MLFYIKVSAKNKKIIQNFKKFLMKLNIFPINVKAISKQTEKEIVTVLKSPHVNKSAQEQFEFQFYNQSFLIKSIKPLMFFLLLKKIKNSNFYGLNIEVTGLLKDLKIKNNNPKLFNPDYMVFLDSIENKKKYIQLFDIYGELNLKNNIIS